MKPFNTKVHGIIDYAMGLLLLAGPYLFGLVADTVESYVLYALGAFTIVYSAITDYELGLIKLLPMKVHLGIDLLSGVALAASPWLFGFAERAFVPFVILGLTEIVVTLLTEPTGRNSTNLI